jgi:hypothetical protein
VEREKSTGQNLMRGNSMKIKTRHLLFFGCLAVLGGFAFDSACAQKDVWTDPEDPTLPKDFEIQGEYVGEVEEGENKALGAQVIALGNGKFQAVLYPGGLPGKGWVQPNKSLMSGELKEDGSGEFASAVGKRTYLAQSPDEFSATSEFPPIGQTLATATIRDGEMTGEGFKSKFKLKKTTRKSDTLGKKPPEGAIVLFDGSSTEHWTGGRLDEETKLLNTDGRDILTKQRFNDYTMHLEFLLPYRPEARGQGRGNSGFYQVDHYEVQILDSFGLEGKNNECGGVYQLADPIINMCLPPLVWQTYDVEFTNAKTNDNGEVTAPAKMTLKHNGVLIHENLEMKEKTGGSRPGAIGTPGPIKLQGHGNPLQFKNIWIVEK